MSSPAGRYIFALIRLENAEARARKARAAVKRARQAVKRAKAQAGESLSERSAN